MLRGRERAREEKIVRSWGEKMDGATTVLQVDEHSRVDASIATREFRKKRKSEKKNISSADHRAIAYIPMI